MTTKNTGSYTFVALLVAMTMSAAAPAQAPKPSSDDSQTVGATTEDFAFARRLSRVFKSVANKVEPAVVHVTQQRMMYQTDFFGRRIGSGRMMQSGLGSGAIVDSDGIVVTNNHVVEGGETLQVKLASGVEYAAKLLGRDPQTDLAVLKIENAPKSLPTLAFADSDAIDVGEWVVAVGSPFGLDNTVTQGIVSARGRSVTPRETGRSYEDYIQTDAAINPGNSGGPLVNLSGDIVGINSAIASRTGGYDGIGFAIPANTVRLAVDSIKKNGRVIRGWLGATLEDIEQRGGQPRVRVAFVEPGSPADHAGLKEGDIIAKFQSVPMEERRMRGAIATLPAGSVVTLDVIRDARDERLTATLADGSTASNKVYIEDLGVTVGPIPKDITKELDVLGVQVRSVNKNSRAQRNQIQPGDLIVSIDDAEVTTPDSFEIEYERAGENRASRLNVIRRNEDGGYDRGYIILRYR